MLDIDEYIIDLLVALVHLRILGLQIGEECPIEDVHQFIMKASDRVPHLEYFTVSHLGHCYKRVGGEFVVCDRMEQPRFEI